MYFESFAFHTHMHIHVHIIAHICAYTYIYIFSSMQNKKLNIYIKLIFILSELIYYKF